MMCEQELFFSPKNRNLSQCYPDSTFEEINRGVDTWDFWGLQGIKVVQAYRAEKDYSTIFKDLDFTVEVWIPQIHSWTDCVQAEDI